jgi:hypothetical protein
MISQTYVACTPASIDADIATLGSALAALHDLARALPAGVTVPLDRHAEFIHMADTLDCLFERLAMTLEAAEIEPA